MKQQSNRQRSLTRTLTVFAGLVLLVVLNGAAQERPAPAAQDDPQLERAGEEITDKVCGACHSVDDVYTSRKTMKQWQGVVADMVSRGASGTDDEIATIKRYLTRYNGVVSVNSAAAEELSAVLGLSATDTAAIVDYRQTNGKFADAEALMKVPGIDKSKIEAQPAALKFD
jgi:competence ComEA-like helix-hairpin-helix protein